MGNIRDKLITVTGKLFDKRRSIVSVTDGHFALLATGKRTDVYIQLGVWRNSYLARSGNFRNTTTVELATVEDISDMVYKASHFSLNGQIYGVSEGDITPPNDTRFTWLVEGHVKNETYTLAP